ncbi:MAG: DUF4131 domain-containing protein, partial [Alphaproteobacteria bacterium]|nr:DUF4131 domain-containing protein [Alphaproteobacteria bacterium]
MGGIADELGRREGALRLPHPRAALTWLAQSALAERERWPLFLPAALATGIGLYFALPTEPTWQMAVASAFGAVGAIATIRASHNAALRVVLSLIAAAALGFAVAKVRTELVAAPVLAQQIGPFGLDGRIEQAEPRGNGIRMVLGELRTKRLASAETPARIRVTVRAATPLPAPGSWVHITAVLMPPPAPAAPGAYDFGRSAYFAGLGAVGYIYGRPTAIAPLRDSTLLERASATLERTRNAMTARIRTILPGPQGAIAAALVTGER